MSDTEEIISGSVIRLEVVLQCGGCGKNFRTEVEDLAYTMPPAWSLFDFAVDTVRYGCTSVQGGHILCQGCTSKVDDAVTEDRAATRAEVERVFANG